LIDGFFIMVIRRKLAGSLYLCGILFDNYAVFIRKVADSTGEEYRRIISSNSYGRGFYLESI